LANKKQIVPVDPAVKTADTQKDNVSDIDAPGVKIGVQLFFYQ
jgi:hypothetical protein